MDFLKLHDQRLRWIFVMLITWMALFLGPVLILSLFGQLARSSSFFHPDGPSGVVGLDLYPDSGKVHLLLAAANREEELAQVKLFYRYWDPGTKSWSLPTEIPTQGQSPRVPHRGDDPQIAVHGSQVVALWTVPGTGYMGAGPMRTALSFDGGKSWQPGPNPSDDQSQGGHEFADLAYDHQGRLHLAWLDSRAGKQGLIYARSLDGGSHWEANRIIDPETCSCCWIRVACWQDHVYMLYRDAPVRDMRMAWSYDGGTHWNDCGWVGHFGWEFQGCPHWGGALAFWKQGRINWIGALVQTGKPGSTGIYFLSSDDHGLTWTSPVRLGDPNARFVDLAGDGNGTLLAAWNQWDGSTYRVWIAKSSDRGVHWTEPQPISPQGITTTHPRVAFCQSNFLVVWTQSKDGLQWDWNWISWPPPKPPSEALGVFHRKPFQPNKENPPGT
ncbi:exo-alpha-sialidase [Candidatus Methylacidithermus pantelleriae]|uniref:Sialidase domain-containing protein n=1 Tax=Candidatus Methylacidithermus pantelleriae TaxID=2744239 RepID=A0A8J2FUR8_9BACT|nr:exo-alpha-sialidase [Candidatus Methylacidithermus pantelleriae]CAF0688773.1 conserved hypothetical protein [Candidatus Methylacidithermus pantelleriae]